MTTYNSTSYVTTSPELGYQAVGTTSTTQLHPLGTTASAVDPTYGSAEFVYVKAAATITQGQIGTIDSINKAFTPAVHSTNARGVLGVAMSAMASASYGWVQVRGANPNVLSTGTTAVGDKVYLTSTSGQVSSSVVSTDGVDGAIFTVATSAGVGGVELFFPSATGNG